MTCQVNDAEKPPRSEDGGYLHTLYAFGALPFPCSTLRLTERMRTIKSRYAYCHQPRSEM